MYSYNLGTGVKYDERQRGERLPVRGVYSVKEIFPDAHSESRKIKIGFQRNDRSSREGKKEGRSK